MPLQPEVRFNIYDNYILEYNQKNSDNQLNSITSSGYALELYTFKFEVIQDSIPDYISNNIFVWEFGDGEYSTEVSPTHWYKAPGKYTVSLVLYGVDENNRFISYQNAYNATITIYNFVPYLEYNTYGDIISAVEIEGIDNNNVNWDEYPLIKFKVNTFNSWQSYDYTNGVYKLNLNVVESNYPLLKVGDYNNNPYLHLSPTDKFLDEDMQPINSIILSSNPIYYTRDLSGSMIQVNDTFGSTLVGLSSEAYFYYSGTPYIVDTPPSSGDMINDEKQTIIEISMDTTNFKEPYETNNNIRTIYSNPILNTKPCKLVFNNVIYIDNDVYSNLTGFINVNGINEPSFNIYQYKYIDKPINFVYRYSIYNNEYDLFPISFINNLTIEPLSTSRISAKLYYNDAVVGNISLKDETGNNIPCIFNSEIVQQPAGYISDQGGYLKGYLISDNEVNNVHIEVTLYNELMTDVLFENISSLSSYVISSNTFDIVTPNQIEIRKINEDFKMYEQFEKASLQPIIKNSSMLNTYVSAVYGDPTDPNSIGVKPYEKISNYVMNIDDIDTCNIECLYNHFYSLSFNISDNNYSWPPNFRRIIDLFSIPFFRLKGYYNEYAEDFDKKGYNNSIYGKNLGDLLDIETYNITAGVPIVAKEKFSGIFTLINTNLIVNTSNTDIETLNEIYPGIESIDGNYIYPLKNYRNDISTNLSGLGWGWNLILPSTDDYKLSNYYEFYEYIPNELSATYSTTNLVNNIIDWNNPDNNVSIEDISSIDKWEEIKKIYIMQNLYNNLVV